MTDMSWSMAVVRPDQFVARCRLLRARGRYGGGSPTWNSSARSGVPARRFESISVADIIAAAGVSRASFYFYFPSKQAVLAELVRRAVDRGQETAQPWAAGERDPVDALRAGVAAGVLRAIVESWGSDDQLRQLWLEQMDSFTDSAVARIQADDDVLRRLDGLDGLDVRAVAASLTWLGERLYYLAAANVPPFDDRDVLVDTLTRVWVRMLYGTA